MAMQRADAGDCGALGELNVAGPARLVPLTALTSDDISIAALRHAARRGRLDAIQGPDGIWRSSRKAVNEYLKTRQRRGRAKDAI